LFVKETKAATQGRRCVVAVLLLALAAMFLAAKCHEPNTRVVVFLQGYYTHYDAQGTMSTALEEHTFEMLKSAFVVQGYAAERLLDYGYEGGTVSAAGEWQPAPYSCGDTDRRSEESLRVLERMLRDYRERHPKAHFTLVGHSLGGLLAFLEGAREAQRPEGERLGIDVVVTLDAPLRGVDADKKIILDNFVPCTVKTYAAGGEVVAAKLDAGTPALRAGQATAMAAQGIRLATLGNANDCLFSLNLCLGTTFVDDGATQYVAEAALSKSYAIASNPLLSHIAVLIEPAVVADTVGFVGAP